MAGIFISYRRNDTQHAAARLRDRLLQTYEPHQLFMDVDNIAPGLDFVDVLSQQVAACEVMLVVIGPTWLDTRDEDGARRLDDPRDFVRIEMEAALKRGVRVIPVLVDGARIPRDDALPEPVRPLTRRQSVRLTHERFGSEADALVRSLRDVVRPSGGRDVELDSQRGAQRTALDPTSTTGTKPPHRAIPGNTLRYWWHGRHVTFHFSGNTQEASFELPEDRSGKPAIRRALDSALDFGRKNSASDGQLQAIRKAFTDEGYHLTR